VLKFKTDYAKKRKAIFDVPERGEKLIGGKTRRQREEKNNKFHLKKGPVECRKGTKALKEKKSFLIWGNPRERHSLTEKKRRLALGWKGGARLGKRTKWGGSLFSVSGKEKRGPGEGGGCRNNGDQN